MSLRLTALGVAIAATLAGWGSLASAQGVVVTTNEEEPYLFVPELDGALTFGLRLGQRLERGGNPLSPYVPDLSLGLDLGYRHYFDYWGQSSVLGYLTGGVELISPFGTLGARNVGDVRTGHVGELGFGVQVQHRFMNDRFVFLQVGFFSELMGLFWRNIEASETGIDSTDIDSTGISLPARTNGFMVQVGLEVGFGWLMVLDPYVYKEIPIFAAYQYTDFGVGSYGAWIFGVRSRFDWVFK